MLSISEHGNAKLAREALKQLTRRLIAITFLLAANKVLQRCARNLRAPALNCAQDNRCI